MNTFVAEHSVILTEGAIVERLRRGGRVELHPSLVHSMLVYDDRGRAELEKLYHGYASIAIEAGLPILLTSPTWRANAERVNAAGVNTNVNADCVRFMHDLRKSWGTDATMIKIGGFIGCKNDSYKAEEGLSAAESERFHSWQIEQLAQAGVDFLMAGTLPNVNEALGIARALEKAGTPYIIGFVIDREGLVLDGTSLWDAVNKIDSSTGQKPLCYMVGCSHPTFLCPEEQPRALFTRLLGIQGNSSSLNHCELDGSAQLLQDDPDEWSREMLHLHREYGLRILGGCCGTDDVHISLLAEAAAA